MAKVIIFGCGRGADTAFRYIAKDSPHQICGFTVESDYLQRQSFHSLPVVAYESIVERFPPAEFAMFIPLGFQGMNTLRANKYLDAKRKGYRFISYINSQNYSLEGISAGENCFIL